MVGWEEGREGGGEEEADLVTPQEWEKLLESYPPEERAGCRKASVIFKKRWIGGGGDGEGGREGGRGESGFSLEADFIPESCPECQMQKEEARERARVSFTSQPLKVILLKEGESPPDAPPPSLPPSSSSSSSSSLSPSTAAAIAAASGRRNAPRSTRGRGGGRKGGNVRILEGISSSDLVGLVRLNVWQLVSGAEEEIVTLFWKGKELREGGRTLREVGVTCDAVLYARVGRLEEGGESMWDYLTGVGEGGGEGGRRRCGRTRRRLGLWWRREGRREGEGEGEGMGRRLIDLNRGLEGLSWHR